jgi:hypothetical protein
MQVQFSFQTFDLIVNLSNYNTMKVLLFALCFLFAGALTAQDADAIQRDMSNAYGHYQQQAYQKAIDAIEPRLESYKPAFSNHAQYAQLLLLMAASYDHLGNTQNAKKYMDLRRKYTNESAQAFPAKALLLDIRMPATIDSNEGALQQRSINQTAPQAIEKLFVLVGDERTRRVEPYGIIVSDWGMTPYSAMRMLQGTMVHYIVIPAVYEHSDKQVSVGLYVYDVLAFNEADRAPRPMIQLTPKRVPDTFDAINDAFLELFKELNNDATHVDKEFYNPFEKN